MVGLVDKKLLQVDDAHGEAFSMHACAFDEGELLRIDEYLHDPGFCSPASFHLARSLSLACPEPWADPFLRMLRQHHVPLRQEPGVPEWAKPLVRGKDFFVGSAIAFVGPGVAEPVWWKILYMSQQPYYMGVCPLVRQSA